LNERVLFFAVLTGSGVAWGASQVLGKWATSTGYQPFGLIFWQFVVAAVLLCSIVFARGRTVPFTRQTITFGLSLALVGTIIPNYAFYYSIVHLPAGIMSIVISASPLLAFPVAIALGVDRFSVWRFAGLALGLLGVALIALPQTSLPDRAMVAYLPIAMIAPLFYAFEANLVGARGTAGMDALQAMAMVSIVGAVVLLPLTIVSGQWINPIRVFGPAEWAMVVGGVIHALAYCTYIWLAGAAGAVFAAQSAYVVTASGVIWAMVLLGERYSAWVWLAMAAMMAGLVLVQPRRREVLATAPASGETSA